MNDGKIDRIAMRLVSSLDSSRVLTGDMACGDGDIEKALHGISVSQYYSAFKNADVQTPSVIEECRSVCMHPNGAFAPEVFVRRYRDGKMTAGYDFVDCVGLEAEYPWWTNYESYPQDSMIGIREELMGIAEDIEEIIIDERNRAMEIRSMAEPAASEDSEFSEEGMEMEDVEENL